MDSHMIVTWRCFHSHVTIWELGRTLYTSCWICDICACRACSSDCSRSCRITYIMSHGSHMMVTWHHTMARVTWLIYDVTCPQLTSFGSSCSPFRTSWGDFPIPLDLKNWPTPYKANRTKPIVTISFISTKKVHSIQFNETDSNANFSHPMGPAMTYKIHETQQNYMCTNTLHKLLHFVWCLMNPQALIHTQDTTAILPTTIPVPVRMYCIHPPTCCHRPLNQQATDTHTRILLATPVSATLVTCTKWSMWEVNVQKWHVPHSPTFTSMPKIIPHPHPHSHSHSHFSSL